MHSCARKKSVYIPSVEIKADGYGDFLEKFKKLDRKVLVDVLDGIVDVPSIDDDEGILKFYVCLKRLESEGMLVFY